MVRTRLNIGCRYSTPVRERPLHPTRGHFTPEPSQTQAPVTPATEPERRAGGSLTASTTAKLLVSSQLSTTQVRLDPLLRCRQRPGRVRARPAPQTSAAEAIATNTGLTASTTAKLLVSSQLSTTQVRLDPLLRCRQRPGRVRARPAPQTSAAEAIATNTGFGEG